MVWILLVVVIIVVVLVKLLRERHGQTDPAAGADLLPYVTRACLLSPAEMSFYNVLRMALPADRQIVIKPRLADVLDVTHGLVPAERRRAFNRISQKHADFVICDLGCTPELVIELDDRSHSQADRSARDTLVDRIYKAAGLPVIHQAAQASYAVTDLRTMLTRLRKMPTVSVA